MQKINDKNNYMVTYENIYTYNNYTIFTILIFFLLLFIYILTIFKKYN
jgi:hypothetical protein